MDAPANVQPGPQNYGEPPADYESIPWAPGEAPEE